MQSAKTTSPSGRGRFAIVSFRSPLEGMRSMCTQRENQLHEQLIAVSILSISGKAILSAKLAEFAGPISQRRSRAFVRQIVELAALRPIKSSAGKPPASELIVTGCIPAERPLLTRKLLPLAPNEFASPNKRVIDRTAQRLPAHGRVNSVELGNEITGYRDVSIIVAASV